MFSNRAHSLNHITELQLSTYRPLIYLLRSGFSPCEVPTLCVDTGILNHLSCDFEHKFGPKKAILKFA